MREGEILKKPKTKKQKIPNNQNMSGLHSSICFFQFYTFLQLQEHDPIVL